ncbi:MAG: hypothetical protein ACJ0BT_01845 [Pseudohongiellaceae bacterium]
MVNRRKVLKLGALGFASGFINLPNQSFAAASFNTSSPISRAIIDDRFEDSLAFAGELNRRGVTISNIDGDIAKLWYQDLQISLRRKAAPIAGLTERTDLFCLEELARDVGMKMFFRVDHLIDANGSVQHLALGPTSLVEEVKKLQPKLGFGQAMAELSNQFILNGSNEGESAQKRTGPYSLDKQTALVSWMMV